MKTTTKTPIKGFESYQIDENGIVYSKKTEKPLAQSESGGQPSKRYLKVHLTDNEGNLKQMLVHRLMAETFIGPIPKGYVIDHLNKNTRDNRLVNLQITTQKINVNRSPIKNSKGWTDPKKVGFAIALYENPYVSVGYETIGQFLGVYGSSVRRWTIGENHGHNIHTLNYYSKNKQTIWDLCLEFSKEKTRLKVADVQKIFFQSCQN